MKKGNGMIVAYRRKERNGELTGIRKKNDELT
jgi:hypothetical protein